MCGIAGFIGRGGLGPEASASLRAMTGAIEHRGPDDEGQWIDTASGVALGHRRLAIIDLSPAGHQPMHAPSGRFVLIFNGEIYNHHQLRERLEQEGRALAWRGHSDTEVLLACFDHWGVARTLEEANGMFAIALWDRVDRRLTLARDRAGEKPLYYGWQGNSFVFASELKAITAHPDFRKVIDRNAVAAFMRFGYVPAPLSIWQGIGKLPPAHRIDIAVDDPQSAVAQAYWDIHAVAARGAAAPAADSPELVDELDALLRDAVRMRMEADVPLGAFLSGGVDSSVVTALMQVQSSRPVRTFSIGFAEQGYDESGYARAVAMHLGTDHHELRVTTAEAQAVLPLIPRIWDEPFADASQIPTYLVNALARREVTVALSGDGGDELFAGYNRHVLGAKIWNRFGGLPRPVRQTMAAVLAHPATGNLAAGVARTTGIGGQVAGLAERLPKIATVMAADTPGQVHARLIAQWQPDQQPVLGAGWQETVPDVPAFADFRNAMLFLDTVTYLPDDILAKVDRAGMAVSLEGRIPFLDHRLIEFAWQVPMTAKIRNGRGKHILREVLYRYVPPALIDRPKAGFAVPVGDWLVGALRDWAEDLLLPDKLQSQGLLDTKMVQEIWQRFKRGERALLPRIWCVLMFEAWYQEQGFS